MRTFSRWQLGRRRQKAAQQALSPALKQALQTPLPAEHAAFEDVRFVCVDLETTGLDPRSDHILSIGTVPIEHGRIDLAGARYEVIDFAGTLDEETLAIHGLTHDALAQGVPLKPALERFLADVSGAVLVAHHAAIEQGFLKAACSAVLGAPFEALWVCTLALERRRMARAGGDVSVRLGQSRERYNLPRYKAHHALMDALAGAELLLAQQSRIRSDGCQLKDLL
ncbi:MAG: exonuclease domain-containing protein [Pseudomonadota bacterium]